MLPSRSRPGTFVGVIGRSGAGKSTMLRMINRLAEPTSGRILFDGLDVTALRGKELRQWRARSAMIFQQFNLVGRLDVLTNVLMGRLAANSGVALAGAALARRGQGAGDVGAGAVRYRRRSPRSAPISSPAASSSGSRSRARWCRSPTSSWPTSRSPRSIRATPAIVMDALLRINKHFGITVLCNLHSLDLARTYCDRLIGMAAGRVVFDGVPAMLTEHIARELYDLEANDVMGGAPAEAPASEPCRRWATPRRPEPTRTQRISAVANPAGAVSLLSAEGLLS